MTIGTPNEITEEVISYYRKYYKEYLRTEWWRNLNKKFIDSDPKSNCYICRRKLPKTILILHHVTYEKLFGERLNREVFILCVDCHQRVHFHKLDGEKVPIDTKILLKRMNLLRSTYYIRNFRLGSFLNKLWFAVS